LLRKKYISLVTIEKINISPRKTYKILLAPLDWGLGHATRCIPIIKELLNQKCEVWVAASGAQKALLQEEFPFLPFVELPGYNVKYGKNRAFTLLKIVVAIPKILIRIKREKAWLNQFLGTEKPDAVISDNRYGLHAPGLFSVFITHQLRIKTPFGQIADTFLQRINYRAIHRFSLCWIPDLEGAVSLAGQLSHPDRLPGTPTRYIGVLSRFERQPMAASCDLLILLSGPEPQRTIFEKKILDQLPSYPGSTILVRGLPGTAASLFSTGESALTGAALTLPRVRVYNHLPAKALNAVICGAGLVLSRAGYSTIMDLLKLGKRAILVPTPGQTEQEYLGRYLTGKQMALCIEQSTFSLSGAIAVARDFSFAGIGAGGATAIQPAENAGNDLLQKEVRSFLETLDSRNL
jgi:hypothetical protein